jgi:hypothetical protein
LSGKGKRYLFELPFLKLCGKIGKAIAMFLLALEKSQLIFKGRIT